MSNFFTTILFIPIYNLLMYLVAVLPGNNLVLAIIAVTIILRLILLPSSFKASKSTIELQKLTPLINEMRKKYKDDQAKQSQEMMKIYKDHKVSPFGSCLPTIIQLVVLLVFYRVLMIGFNSDHFNLLYSFIPRPESINLFFFGIDVSRPDLWILPILAGALQFVQSKMIPTPPVEPGKNDPSAMMTKQMVYFFPVITIVIARSLPAGLAIYWVITSIFMIAQQWYINSKFDLGFFGHFPHIPVSKLPEYTIEDESNPDGSEKKITGKRKSGVEITVRKKK